MDPDAAAEFASRWLPAWTGNDPDGLLAFYAPDAFYCDPAVPDGLVGHDQIRPYFEKLLARFPDWTWRQSRSVPLAAGFLNYWHATIPSQAGVIRCSGVCTVQIDAGLIARNEVYFDRSGLLEALRG